MEILDAKPDANPNPGTLWVKLAGPCDSLRLEVFTRAFHKVSRQESQGSTGPGWVRLSLGGALSSQPSGVYVLKVVALRSGQSSRAALIKVLVSR